MPDDILRVVTADEGNPWCLEEEEAFNELIRFFGQLIELAKSDDPDWRQAMLAALEDKIRLLKTEQ